MSDFPNTVLRFLGLARYTTLDPNLSDGDSSEWRCDSKGRLMVTFDVASAIWSDGGTSTHERVVKNGAGSLIQIFGRNTGGAIKYLFIFDASARPSDGVSTHKFVPIGVDAGLAFRLDLPRARTFANGIYWGVSSTDNTFTHDGSATFQVSAEYA